jgi:cobalamin biosynthesis protein CobT
MAVLGKRKAPEPIISTEDAQEIFRRHFEAQFLPLPEAERKAREKEEEDDDSEDGSDGSEDEGGEWGGLSNDDEGSDDEDDDDDELDEDDDDDGRTSRASIANASPLTLLTQHPDSPTVEVVDHSGSQAPKISTMSKRELKAFMVSLSPIPCLRLPQNDHKALTT